MHVTTKKEWFEDWFDSTYYHLLYRERDISEAAEFIAKLIDHFELDNTHHVVDLACGKGRHARMMSEKGLKVTGLDISPASIAFANRFKVENLTFHVHDMRLPFPVSAVDMVFNFFTSFGYFAHFEEQATALQNICDSLKQGGTLILDYMNAEVVKKQLVPSNHKIIGDIRFDMTRRLEEGRFIKDIRFEDDGVVHNYQEKVWALTLTDFEKLLAPTCLRIVNVFGNYDLGSFDPAHSDRLIIEARKD